MPSEKVTLPQTEKTKKAWFLIETTFFLSIIMYMLSAALNQAWIIFITVISFCFAVPLSGILKKQVKK